MFAEGEAIASVIKLCVYCKKSTGQLLGCTQRNNGADSPFSFASQSSNKANGVRSKTAYTHNKTVWLLSKFPNKPLLKTEACQAQQCFSLWEMHSRLFRFKVICSTVPVFHGKSHCTYLHQKRLCAFAHFSTQCKTNTCTNLKPRPPISCFTHSLKLCQYKYLKGKKILLHRHEEKENQRKR